MDFQWISWCFHPLLTTMGTQGPHELSTRARPQSTLKKVIGALDDKRLDLLDIVVHLEKAMAAMAVPW